MNKRITNITMTIGLLLGLGLLTGCNTTMESSSHQVRSSAFSEIEASDADYLASQKLRNDEVKLMSKLRINNRDIESVLKLAQLREATGQKRLARRGYRQVVKASIPATDKNETMKTVAAERLAVLRSDVVSPQTLAINLRF